VSGVCATEVNALCELGLYKLEAAIRLLNGGNTKEVKAGAAAELDVHPSEDSVQNGRGTYAMIDSCLQEMHQATTVRTERGELGSPRSLQQFECEPRMPNPAPVPIQKNKERNERDVIGMG
jgi:hypothetical protein